MLKLFGGARASISVDLIEPIVFLQDGLGWIDPSTTSSAASLRAPSQIRGIVKLKWKGGRVSKCSCVVVITLRGISKVVNWRYGSPQESSSCVYAQEQRLDLAREPEDFKDDEQLVPFTIIVPSHLAPTVEVEFGGMEYSIEAELRSSSRNAALASLGKPVAVRMVYDPFHTNAMGARSQSKCGEWPNLLLYKATLASNLATIAGALAFEVEITPLTEDIQIHNLQIHLQEHTVFLGSEFGSTKDIRRSWRLLNEGRTDIASISSLNALPTSADCHSAQDVQIAVSAKLNGSHDTPHPTSLSLPFTLQIPSCERTRLTPSIDHVDSPVRVTHSIHFILRASRSAQPSTVLECNLPLTLRSIYFSQPYSQLPCYWCSIYAEHPYTDQSHEDRQENHSLTANSAESQSPSYAAQGPKKDLNANREHLARQWLALTGSLERIAQPHPSQLSPPPLYRES